MDGVLIPAGTIATGPSEDALTDQVANFTSDTQWSDVPAQVRTLGRKSVLDWLGLTLAGSVSVPARIVRQVTHVAEDGCHEATVAGVGFARADVAALINGLAAHVDDYDDIQLAAAPDRTYGLLMHPSAPVLAATLAVAERVGAPGPSLMCAYHVGVEVACAIAEAIDPRHYGYGFHTTGTCGTIGAAAGVANLLALPAVQVRTALGIAASEASGLRASFGTMTKALHAGRAAQNAVTAVDLAAAGFTSSRSALGARNGFFSAAGAGPDAAWPSLTLGDPWTFASPGIAIKPYPCASLTHPAVEAIIAIASEHGLHAADVRRVRVGISAAAAAPLVYHQPETDLEAKFSMEFCVAVALLSGSAGPAEFELGMLGRADLRDCMQKIAVEVDPRADAAGLDRMTTFLEAELSNGTVIGRRNDFPPGTPRKPLSYDEVAAKIRACVTHAGFDDARSDALAELPMRLETSADVSSITADLRAGRSGRR
jgi:2-methylcitrate dehydratase PrpD